MAGMRYQPQGRFELLSAYREAILSGWLATASGYTALGTRPVVETQRFSEIKRVGVTSSGYALSSESATDGGGIASLSLSSVPVRNNFTFAGIFRVRGIVGAGVGARSNSNDIYLWRQGTGYQLRINNQNFSGPTFPLNTDLHYVLTSNAEGVFLCVNGGVVIRAGAIASPTETGVGVEVFEDSRGGGGMNMDSPLCFMMPGISMAEAQVLSSNLWQIFASDDDLDYFPESGAHHVFAIASAGMTIQGGQARMIVSRRMKVQSTPLTLEGGPAQLRASRRMSVAPAGGVLAGGPVGMRVTRRISIMPAAIAIEGQQVSFVIGSRAGVIDASKVPPSRTVKFAGGKRVVIFSGGLRVATFNGGKRTVRF